MAQVIANITLKKSNEVRENYVIRKKQSGHQGRQPSMAFLFGENVCLPQDGVKS